MADEQVVVILEDGKTTIPERFILSKTGKDGFPKRVQWINEGTEHDVDITFANSPFMTKSFKVIKKGGKAESGDINPNAKPTDPDTQYTYEAKPESAAIAADPEVIIRN